jgi:hypothetical protein
LVKVRAVLIGIVAVVSLVGCTEGSPPASPATVPAVESPAPGPTTAAPAAFTGDLLTLLAPAPAYRQMVSAPARADVAAMARAFSEPSPAPYAQRLGALGYRQGITVAWELSQLSVLSVKVIQLADEAAARTWVTEQRATFPPDSDLASYASMNLTMDFDNGARGGWYISRRAEADSETAGARQVRAVFHRHEIVVQFDIVMLTDKHVPALAQFADEQDRRLP